MKRARQELVQEGLPTFCHINEYDVAGYANLDRMIAVSDPLCVWAPSGNMLDHPDCRIDVPQFCEMVELGHVRVMARADWFTPAGRKNWSDLWPGAEWHPALDNFLKEAFEGELKPPSGALAVFAAGEQGGTNWADKTVDQDPGLIDVWMDIINTEVSGSSKRIPAGTLAVALRKTTDTEKVKALYRDAWNHHQALVDSEASLPIHLNPAESKFVELLQSIQRQRAGGPEAGLHPITTDPAHLKPTVAEALATDLINVLVAIDREKGPRDLESFMHGNAHRELIIWLRQMIAKLRTVDPELLAGQVASELKRQLEYEYAGRETLRARLRSGWVEPAASVAASGIGLATGAGIIGALIGAVPYAIKAGSALFEEIGKKSMHLEKAPQWPFLYLEDRPARSTSLVDLHQRLRLL